jgi:hypothetical protein
MFLRKSLPETKREQAVETAILTGEFASDPAYVLDLLRLGTLKARERTEATVAELRAALGLFMLT